MALLLVGCKDDSITPAQRARLKDRGPFPDNYQVLTRTFLNRGVTDPADAVYDVSPPVEAELPVGSVLSPKEDACWRVHAVVRMRPVETTNPSAPVEPQAYDVFIKRGIILKTEKTPPPRHG